MRSNNQNNMNYNNANRRNVHIKEESSPSQESKKSSYQGQIGAGFITTGIGSINKGKNCSTKKIGKTLTQEDKASLDLLPAKKKGSFFTPFPQEVIYE